MGLTSALISAGLAAAGSVAGSLASNAQSLQQAEYQEAQAKNLQVQANMQEGAANARAAAIDRRKSKLRRDYERIAGQNAIHAGAGNVDLGSGSVAQVAEGNANLFATDMADNAYEKAMAIWQGYQEAKNTRYQADQLRAQAEAAQKQASNPWPTLLKAGLAGAQGYVVGGGLKGFGKADGTEDVIEKALRVARKQAPGWQG